MSVDATVPVTKLDAVNRMLASIGQSPVNTLTGTLPKDVNKAVITIDNATRDICSQSWSFNTDTDYELTADGNGKIAAPSNSAFVSSTYGYNYFVRWDTDALRMYDADNRTFTFADSIKADIIWLFNFEELPQHARHYIAMHAGREFQAAIVGSTVLYKFTKEMELESWAGFRRIEKRAYNNFNINNNSVAANRYYNPPRY